MAPTPGASGSTTAAFLTQAATMPAANAAAQMPTRSRNNSCSRMRRNPFTGGPWVGARRALLHHSCRRNRAGSWPRRVEADEQRGDVVNMVETDARCQGVALFDTVAEGVGKIVP